MSIRLPAYEGMLSAADYHRLRDDLLEQHPEDLDELQLRCVNTGAGSTDADQLWLRMGDKPLFMNNSVTAGRKPEQAWANGLFPSWTEFSSDGWDITDLEQGHPRADARFEVRGARAIDFVKNSFGKNVMLDNGERLQMPSTAKFRLYAMQQFARWLKSHAGSGQKIDALNDIAKTLAPGAPIEGVRALCVELAEKFGLNWGVTTVLHGLMDAGFHVVKPDIHVVQTVAKLGCLRDPGKALNDPGAYLKKESSLFEVVDVARQLAPSIVPLPQSQGKAIREVDVVLMRANYRGIVDGFTRSARTS